jgi:hypothetical protein
MELQRDLGQRHVLTITESLNFKQFQRKLVIVRLLFILLCKHLKILFILIPLL